MEDNMEEIIKEKTIDNALSPISMEGMEIILNQMKNSICKIYTNDGNTGTGFFCLLPYFSQPKYLPFLITNEHVINENFINNNDKIIISLDNNRINKKINLKEKRKIFINKDLDVALIEIKPNIDDIDINNCVELDNDILDKDDEYNNNILTNKSIYL